MFETRPGALARKTDPQTSHDAAAAVDFNRLERIMLKSLIDHGEMTMSEIAKCVGEERDSLSPRMPRLVEIGFVIDTGRKRAPERFGLKEAHENKVRNAALMPTVKLKRRAQQIIWAITEAGKKAING